MILKENKPLVTIVTPTYNMENYLEECINSILNQDYENIEYIVINDGSQDGTEEILEKYKNKIKIINQKNIGQVATLNKGWSLAEGFYLSYLSADDVLFKNAISKMVSILEADKNIACIYPDANLIDKKSKVIRKNVCKETNIEELIVNQECFIGPGAIFRSDLYKITGPWCDEFRLAPDREFWVRLSRYGKIEFFPTVLANYRKHSGSFSVKEASEKVSNEYLLFLDRYYCNNDVLPALKNRKNEAYAMAKFKISRNRFRDFDLVRGIVIYKDACKLNPNLKKIKFKLQLLRGLCGFIVKKIF